MMKIYSMHAWNSSTVKIKLNGSCLWLCLLSIEYTASPDLVDLLSHEAEKGGERRGICSWMLSNSFPTSFPSLSFPFSLLLPSCSISFISQEVVDISKGQEVEQEIRKDWRVSFSGNSRLDKMSSYLTSWACQGSLNMVTSLPLPVTCSRGLTSSSKQISRLKQIKHRRAKEWLLCMEPWRETQPKMNMESKIS